MIGRRLDKDGQCYASGLRFARRMFAPRLVGLGLGTLAVGAVFYTNEVHRLIWFGLFLHGFVWPFVAWTLARSSTDPYRTEIRSLLVDSTLGGMWIALMQFNLLPSVLLASMLSMDKLSVGSWRLLMHSAALQGMAGAVTTTLLGFPVQIDTSMLQIVACIPLLVVYPGAVGVITYRLARQVRDQNRQLAELSRTDSLTQLNNRAAWAEAVNTAFAQSQHTGNPASLLMIDLDHFKAINDRYGHPAGDEVLRQVATLLRDAMRQFDTVGRYGGEEFSVVLPETPLTGALNLAERIRAGVAAALFPAQAGQRCTVSIGVAEWQPEFAEPGDWIEQADRALYQAKQGGRNQVVAVGRVLCQSASEPR